MRARIFAYPICLLPLSFGIALAQSNVDPAHRFAWGENVGWTNWRGEAEPGQGVVVHATFLEGFIWAENIGWINVGDGTPEADCEGQPCYANLDGAHFGVNVDPATGQMYGLAWGENIGWINFEGGAMATPPIPATVDFCNHELGGYVWGENVGWINLDDAAHFVALGPCALADYDCDTDVDLDDYSAFPMFLKGPEVPVDCPAFDADEDGDIDLADFAALQRAVD